MVSLYENATYLIVTGKPSELDTLVDDFKFQPPGYFYALSYQRWKVSGGQEGWDSYIRPMLRINSTSGKILRGRKEDVIRLCEMNRFPVNLEHLLPYPFADLELDDVRSDLIAGDFELDVNQRQCICDWLIAGIGFNKATVGAGKCLAKGTHVMLFTGKTKPVEDIKINDLLMGPDSKSRRVMALGRGKAPMYRITQSNGNAYVCNDEHVMSLQFTAASGHKTGEVLNISVKGFLTLEPYLKKALYGYKVGIQLRKKPVPIEPYFLGLWLGDGSSAAPAITTGDPEIVDYVKAYSVKVGLNLREEEGSGCSTWHLHVPQRKFCACGKKHCSGGFCSACYEELRRKGCRPLGRRNNLAQALRQLGVLNNKHIPSIYKFNSRSVRCQLLAGLIDSDGWVHHNGQVEIVSVRKTLAENICWVARSLGYESTIRPKKTTCQTGVIGLAYRIRITGCLSEIPTLIARKKLNDCKWGGLRTRIQVEPIGAGDYYGFELSGDGLFLLDDFTVTHNTAMYGGAAALIKEKYPDGRFIYITPSERLVKQVTVEMRKFLPHFDIGQCGGGHKQFDAKDMVVCTVAMLSKNFNSLKGNEFFNSFVALLFDEVHHSCSPSATKVALAIPAYFRLGASDTSKEKDPAKYNQIRGLFGPMLNEVIAAPLIKSGRLAKPHIYIVDVPGWKGRFNDVPYRPELGSPVYALLESAWVPAKYAGPVYELDAAGVPKVKMVKTAERNADDDDWIYSKEPITVPGLHRLEIDGVEHEVESRWCLLDRLYDKAVIQFKSRNALIVEWAKYFSSKGWSTIVVATRTTHVYILEALLKKALPENKVNILVGEDSPKARDEMFEWFKSNPGSVLVSPLIREGVSINQIKAMIVADCVADVEISRQICGRAMRSKGVEDNRAHIIFFWDRQHPTLNKSCKKMFQELEQQDGFSYFHPCAGPASVFKADFSGSKAHAQS